MMAIAKVAQVAKIAEKEIIVRRAGKGGPKPAAKEQQSARKGYTMQPATAAQVAMIAENKRISRRAGKRGPKTDIKPHNHKKDPKRGHHVINNGVRRIHPKIIDDFLQRNADYFYSFEEHGFIEPEMNIYRSHEHPFNEEDDHFIQTTVVFTPGEEIHRDINGVQYGTLTGALRVGVSHYMTSLFLMRVWQMPMEQEAEAISLLAHEINSNSNEVYVDRQALEWWIETGGNGARFIEVRDVVANSFRDLTGEANLIRAWVHDLVDVYERMYNIHL